MPNDFLHPKEIARFYEIYGLIASDPQQFFDNARDYRQKALIREFQTLIQKIDYENNPLRDDFQLAPDGNNVEEYFDDGIDGGFGNDTIIAANAARDWLDQPDQKREDSRAHQQKSSSI